MSAIISPCGRYRYTLQRDGIPGATTGTVVFCMLNPSTADASIDDPTIRRCRGFTERWGCAGLMVVNLYGLRATDPRELQRVSRADAIGPENDDWLGKVAIVARVGVCAWGAGAAPDRVAEVVRIFRIAGANMYCLGVTKDGHPRHPLYMPGNSRPMPWAPRVAA